MPKSFMKLNANNVPINALVISSITKLVGIYCGCIFTNAVYLAMISNKFGFITIFIIGNVCNSN